MTSSWRAESDFGDSEAEWRAALVQAEYARRDYDQCLRGPDRDESELGRLWLRLWLAERRREELFRRLK